MLYRIGKILLHLLVREAEYLRKIDKKGDKHQHNGQDRRPNWQSPHSFFMRFLHDVAPFNINFKNFSQQEILHAGCFRFSAVDGYAVFNSF